MTEQPGFYRIALRGDGRSHAMGVQNLGNGEFKFMDPNSGEFHLRDEFALKQVVTQNARRMGYANDASSFEIQHLIT
ncbi:YopT-type cysteine protease domain-containing protein [Cystobacter fuscus]